MFTDIEGSTKLWESAPDRMREALAVHDEVVAEGTERHSGFVFKRAGDSFCAAFKEPRHALQAALDIQRRLASTNWPTAEPIRARIGIHTGTAQIRDEDYFGPTLNRVSRLMAAGHGGQILLSGATHRILIEDLPAEVELVSLGSHRLKDLDRPEDIYQVNVEGLVSDHPPLRTASQSGGGPIERAEQAYHSKQWKKVAEILGEVEAVSELDGPQHELFGYALWWLGEHDQIIRRFELAYNAFVAEGKPERAAKAAVELAELHAHNLSPDLAAGWVRRASRLLESDDDSSAKGYLLRWESVQAFDRGDLEAALTLADRVGQIGRANSDGNLEVLSLVDRGRILVATGRLEEGMSLMDEAMTAAVAGDVTPAIVGRSYCNMLAVCDQTGDIRRAAEWSQAAEQWCEESEASPYPGICRIYKAEVMWLNGDWVGAETEVLRASGELGLYTDISGEAWYQYGVMRLRAHDLDGAEQAFQEALTRGREPVPGYAYVLKERGDLDSAIDLLNRSLDGGLSKLDRARFLPALIELSVEKGDLDTASQAVEELTEIAELARSDYFHAQAAHGRGAIELAREPGAAIDHLREAARSFSRLRLPFESARARSDLAKAYIADGAEAFAKLELDAARSEFRRLGAEAEVKTVELLLGV